jgi:hypothetical protein
MAKKKKNIYYIIAAIVVVVVLVAWFMRKPAVEEEKEMPEEAAEEMPEEAAPEMPTPKVPTEYVGDILSDVVCIGDEIQATITNTGDQTEKIGDKLVVQVNGLVVRAPVCEKMTLAPGESVRCSDVSGPFAIRTGKENLVIVKLKGDSSQATVTCE